jgi:hypothetical protein
VKFAVEFNLPPPEPISKKALETLLFLASEKIEVYKQFKFHKVLYSAVLRGITSAFLRQIFFDVDVDSQTILYVAFRCQCTSKLQT